MVWEIFRGGREDRDSLKVTVSTNGFLTLNRAAWLALGLPYKVHLLWDRDRRLIGLRAVGSLDPDGYSVTNVQGAGRITAKAFLQYHGVETSATRRWPAEMLDRVLCIAIGADEPDRYLATPPELSDAALTHLHGDNPPRRRRAYREDDR